MGHPLGARASISLTMSDQRAPLATSACRTGRCARPVRTRAGTPARPVRDRQPAHGERSPVGAGSVIRCSGGGRFVDRSLAVGAHATRQCGPSSQSLPTAGPEAVIAAARLVGAAARVAGAAARRLDRCTCGSRAVRHSKFRLAVGRPGDGGLSRSGNTTSAMSLRFRRFQRTTERLADHLQTVEGFPLESCQILTELVARLRHHANPTQRSALPRASSMWLRSRL